MWSNLRCWLFLSAEITGPDRMCYRFYHLYKLFLLPVIPPFTPCSRLGSVPTFLLVLFSFTESRCWHGVVNAASTLLVKQMKKFRLIPGRGKRSFLHANCPGWIWGPICIHLPFLRCHCRGQGDRGMNRTLHVNTEVKNGCSYTSTPPYVFITCTENFSFAVPIDLRFLQHIPLATA